MAYTVLARRFRSQTFDDVVGQDAVAQTLKNAIKSGRVAHAYLFTGTRGVGKTTMARILAKALNCLKFDEPTTKPCCKCDSCVSVNAGEDIDVIEIDGASNTGVDNIRQLRQNAIYRPARARYKIYIIDEVHMLSTGAFNALLKILEEPPEHVKFIFATTEPNKVLPTIQSRCQRFDFGTINPDVIGEQLKNILKSEKVKFDADVLIALSRLANGSMRDALSLLDQLISTGVEPLTLDLLEESLGQPNRAKICELIGRMGDHEAGAVLEAIDELLKTGQVAVQILDSLIDLMRDLIVIKSTSAKSGLLVLTAAERKTMSALAEKFDTAALIYNITAMEKLRWTIKNSDNPRALLEASMLRLTLSEHFMGLQELLSRVDAAGGKACAPVRPGVKKNAPTRVNKRPQTTSAAAQAETDAKIAPVITGEVNAETIADNWPLITAALKAANSGTGVFLDAATPAGFEGGEGGAGGVLSLSFAKSAQLARSMCEKRSAQIESFLTEALGTRIRLRFETSNDQTPSQAAPAPGARMDKETRQKALSDPAVQTLLTGLDATVTDIEELKK
ncbi:MAG: DNA polymerase III subunit gamma/tau [Planctomycetota bacterium]|nr:MAG: DNA polymerase III subunit gamma/tau [Planctomycetota bacterium]